MSYIIPEKCIKYVKMYQPVIKYNYQLEQEKRKKGFYNFKYNSNECYLVPLNTLFEIKNSISTIKVESIQIDSFKKDKIYQYDKYQDIHNDYLVGYSINSKQEINYVTFEFKDLPGNVLYCYKNIK